MADHVLPATHRAAGTQEPEGASHTKAGVLQAQLLWLPRVTLVLKAVVLPAGVSRDRRGEAGSRVRVTG